MLITNIDKQNNLMNIVTIVFSIIAAVIVFAALMYNPKNKNNDKEQI